METDIQGGVQMGYKTILVPAQGIANKEELSNYAFKPDVITGSVDKIGFPLKWLVEFDSRKSLSPKSKVNKIMRLRT